MAAFDKMVSAMNAKRKEWYGDNWEKVSWYGVPLVFGEKK